MATCSKNTGECHRKLVFDDRSIRLKAGVVAMIRRFEIKETEARADNPEIAHCSV